MFGRLKAYSQDEWAFCFRLTTCLLARNLGVDSRLTATKMGFGRVIQEK
jgi:hypothetical protein